MKKIKTPGLGALLLLTLIMTGCLEQPVASVPTSSTSEPPIVIIDGTGGDQPQATKNVPTTAPTATHLTTPLATAPENKVAERDVRIASPAPAEQVVKRPEVIRGNEIPVSSGTAAANASNLSWIDPDAKSPAEDYISTHGGAKSDSEIGGCTFTVVSGDVIVIHGYPSTLSFSEIQEVCAPYLPGYTFSNKPTFVVATPKS